LGAFSLGLLFHGSDAPIEFARSSRIYSLILLVLTTFVVPLTCFPERIVWLVSGYLLVAFFAIYIGCVGWAITRGALTAPEDSEDSSDDESSREDDEGQNERCISGLHSVTTPLRADETTPFLTELPGFEDDPDNRRAAPIIATTRIQSNTRHGRCHTLHHHVGYLLFGFLAIFLAGYVLAHAATTIADEFEISDVLFGVVILSIATTLPEKFVAIMSGQRGHAGILVANTAGSNVFLLALCLGIVMLDTSGEFQRGNVNMAELGVLWVSTVAFTSTVCFGGKFSRWIGVAMLTAYVVFIILEFTILHGVAMDD
jgi:Ca2+/Na+ antiporter